VKRDLEHLKLLTIFHFVLAGLVALIGSIFIFHLVMGILMLTGNMPGPRPGTPGAPPAFMGWFMFGLGAFMLLFSWSLALCLGIAGYCLSRRKGWMFCCLVAGFACLNAPLGTALGVFTLLVLLRPRVKDLFAGRIIEPRDPEDDDDDDYERPRPRPRARRDDDVRPEHEAAIRPRPDEGRFTEK
jgi:hypothetical protein